MKKGIMILAAMMLATALSVFARDNKAEIASLRKDLSDAGSGKDSIKILYDIFDLTDRKNFPSVLKEIDNVAARIGDNATRLDVARNLANIYKSDSLMSVIQEHVLLLPPSEDQKETLLFIKMRQITRRELSGNASQSHANIAKIIADSDTASMDKYDRVLRAFNICEYLSIYAPGPLLLEYMDELEEEMKKADLKNMVLKNLFLSESANVYTGMGETQRAVDADRKLLKVIDDMEKGYKARGRTYRNYDASKFVIYRRMLSNYPALSLDEANDIYDKIMKIVEGNPDAAEEYVTHRRVSVYHAMKNKNYDEALKHLKVALPTENSSVRRRHLLEMQIEAAEAVGDANTAEAARQELAVLNEALSSEEAVQKYNELQVRYQVSSLQAENAELELENKNEQIANSRRSIILVSVLWIVFAIVIIISLFYWTRYRRILTGLHSFVNAVGDQRDSLKKRRYYDYDRSSYNDNPEVLSEYRNIQGNKHDSVSLMNKVVNDILFISSISMEDARKYRQDVKVGKLMKECISTVTANLHRNINVNVTYPEPDFSIRVDKECLQKLIDQILLKAEQLAPEGGSISFGCTLDGTAQMARFVFKHSGSGLPHGEEERIFDGFFNIEREPGDGDSENALLICRMISFLSGCSLKSSSGRANVSGGQLTLMVPLS